MRAVLLAGFLGLLSVMAAHSQTSLTVYEGACDGSAAVALDADHFIVANDDENKLRIYRRGVSEAVKDSVIDLNPALKTEPKRDGPPKEADLEGAARVGNRIYWIGSHGRDSEGHKEVSRHRFFATDIVAGTGTPPLTLKVTAVYKDLLKDLLEQVTGLGLKEGEKLAAEAPNGLNIEGLAATPDGQLLIGFRNPLPAGKAIVIPLTNPADVLDKNAKAVFGKPEQLDLGNRGIRSIEWVNNRYLIVAGPFDNGGPGQLGGDFALYKWSGPGGPAPAQDLAVAFGKLHPEALFATSNPKEVYVLSDDGTKACKDLDKQKQKRFRGLAITISD